MAYEQKPVDFIKSVISKEPKTGWDSAHVAGKLSDDVIEMAATSFTELDKRTKLDLLLSSLHFKHRDLTAVKNSFVEICKIANTDDDDFVNIMANILETYPETQRLNIDNIKHWDHSDSVLNKLKSFIKQHGISFHSPEYMILDPKVRPVPSNVSPDFTQWQPTTTRHCMLTENVEDRIHAISPGDQLAALAEREERAEQGADVPIMTAQKRPSMADITGMGKRILTSPTSNVPNPFSSFASPPTTPTSGSFPRPIRPPPPRAAPAGGSSLFITKPKPRSAGKPIQRTPSGSRTSASVPRGFQRQQRVQMLDFKAASEFEQNASAAIKKANEDLRAQKEEEKQEKKRVAEEKKGRKSIEVKKARKNSIGAAGDDAVSILDNTQQSQDIQQQQQQQQQIQQIQQQQQQQLQPQPQKQPHQLPVKKAYAGKKTEF
ncbi:hypothetical protein G6F37_010508 [Rhizopus arrhizus]|nr:hypothetical protein G6F37_010508 [Rhizopus arrhizus]